MVGAISKPSVWRNLRRSLRYLLPFWHLQSLALLCALVAVALSMVNPWVNKVLIDDVVINRDIGRLNFVCLVFLGSVLLGQLFRMLQTYLFTFVGEKAVVNMRADVLHHLHQQSLAFFHQQRTGTLMSHFTSDIPAMQGLYTDTLVNLITNVLQLAAGTILMFCIDPTLAAITLLTLPFFIIAAAVFAGPVRRIARRVQDKNAEISQNLQEGISGVREVKAFTREADEEARHVGVFGQLLKLRLRQQVIQSGSNSAALVAVLGGVAFVLWYGGLRAIRGHLTMGDLMAFLGYLGMLYGPIGSFMQLHNLVQAAMGAAERVFGFLDTAPDVKDKPNATALPRLSRFVRFADVTFAYESNEPVLRNISLDVQVGETIAIVGPSGSGKTTLVNLIPRFADPTSGAVLIDGHDLRDVSLASLRAQVSVVFQDTFLFGATVRDNIRYGRPQATDAEVIAAARAANAHSFIEALPQGYDTEVGERGAKLSGGQKQRLSIARTILRDPAILILDEATSALDSESEQLVQDALARLMRGCTSFVIAHRLSTIMEATRIVVLEEGRVAEIGRHDELLARNGVYRKLYDAQVGGMIQARPGAEPAA